MTAPIPTGESALRHVTQPEARDFGARPVAGAARRPAVVERRGRRLVVASSPAPHADYARRCPGCGSSPGDRGCPPATVQRVRFRGTVGKLGLPALGPSFRPRRRLLFRPGRPPRSRRSEMVLRPRLDRPEARSGQRAAAVAPSGGRHLPAGVSHRREPAARGGALGTRPTGRRRGAFPRRAQ